MKNITAKARAGLMQLKHDFGNLTIPGNHEMAFTENRELPCGQDMTNGEERY